MFYLELFEQNFKISKIVHHNNDIKFIKAILTLKSSKNDFTRKWRLE